MTRIIAVLISFVGAAWIIYFICATKNLSTPEEILLPLLLSALLSIVWQAVISVYGYAKFLPKLIYLIFAKRALRISFASLIRIKAQNKYLLVKSKRNNLFQPVGGVLRFYDKTILNRFGLSDDQSYSQLPSDEFRLRFEPGNLGNIFKFLRWFESQKGREIDPHREFYEELIDMNILDQSIFSKPQFSYLKRVTPAIKWGNHFQVHELFLFEIFEMILSPEQENFILQLSQKTSQDEFALMTSEEIQKGGFNGTTTRSVGNHTVHIL